MTYDSSYWLSGIRKELIDSIGEDAFWRAYLQPVLCGFPVSYSVHLAILVEPYLQFILAGKKTVESRFSARRIAPYKQVRVGDVLLLKRSGGPIVGLCEVGDTWFYQLDPSSWLIIRKEFTEQLCAQDPSFWQSRKGASFATLMRIRQVFATKPIHLTKQDRRGWVILYHRQQRLSLTTE